MNHVSYKIWDYQNTSVKIPNHIIITYEYDPSVISWDSEKYGVGPPQEGSLIRFYVKPSSR